jgi:hypothetical protein
MNTKYASLLWQTDMSIDLETPDHKVCCPRCGYDQRGVIATWIDSCPMQGTCSECGLNWEWGELFAPYMQLPVWSIEGARNILQQIWALPATFGLMHYPKEFWRDLKMHDPIRFSAFVRSLVFWFVSITLIFACAVGRIAWQSVPPGTPLSRSIETAMYAAVSPFSSSPPNWYALPSWKFSTGPPGPTHWWRYFAGHYYFPDPANLQVALLTKNPWDFAFSFWFFDAGEIVMLLASAAIPLCFMLLPVTVRRSRIRPVHLVRISMYSMFWPFLFVTLKVALRLPDFWMYTQRLYNQMLVIEICVGPILLWFWWRSALKYYLHVPNATALASCVVVMGWLLVFMAVIGPAAIFV